MQGASILTKDVTTESNLLFFKLNFIELYNKKELITWKFELLILTSISVSKYKTPPVSEFVIKNT